MSPDRAGTVWHKMIEAEIRSLYFADLAAKYTRHKQVVVGLSFVLSSGGAVSLLGDGPAWIAATAALVIAALNGYSLAVSLDTKSLKMSRLHASWNRLSDDYERLWHSWHDRNADATLDRLHEKGIELSETSNTEAPYDRQLMDKWSDHVISLYSPVTS